MLATVNSVTSSTHSCIYKYEKFSAIRAKYDAWWTNYFQSFRSHRGTRRFVAATGHTKIFTFSLLPPLKLLPRFADTSPFRGMRLCGGDIEFHARTLQNDKKLYESLAFFFFTTEIRWHKFLFLPIRCRRENTFYNIIDSSTEYRSDNNS